MQRLRVARTHAFVGEPLLDLVGRNVADLHEELDGFQRRVRMVDVPLVPLVHDPYGRRVQLPVELHRFDLRLALGREARFGYADPGPRTPDAGRLR